MRNDYRSPDTLNFSDSVNLLPDSLCVDFGCIVSIPNLTALLSSDTADRLRHMLSIHGLLVIRAVPLTPRQQIDFSRAFGEVEILPWQPSQLVEHPEIFRVSNHADHGLVEVGSSWHSDGAYLKLPREISIFHIVRVPEHGGETQFTSLQGAFDAASTALLKQLYKKYLIFEDGVTQPIVRRHPVTGRLGLYVTLGSSRKMNEERIDIADALFTSIEDLLSRNAAVYTHKWQEGDIVVADNFCVAHRARATPPRYLRILHRTTIVGGRRVLK